jgi:hypothetical protein
MQAALDENNNSPWDAVWYEGDDEDIGVLDSQMRLGAIWKAPVVHIEKRNQRPDIFVFQLYFAVTRRVRDLLSGLVGDTAEFLPLRIHRNRRLYAIHALLRVDFDKSAVFRPQAKGQNITVIEKYSFEKSQLRSDVHVFQVRQAQGSAARDAGYACSGLLVSREFNLICESNGFRGVTFNHV